eukprot:7067784-Pyramimonas_sp.AAC.1
MHVSGRASKECGKHRHQHTAVEKGWQKEDEQEGSEECKEDRSTGPVQNWRCLCWHRQSGRRCCAARPDRAA